MMLVANSKMTVALGEAGFLTADTVRPLGSRQVTALTCIQEDKAQQLRRLNVLRQLPPVRSEYIQAGYVSAFDAAHIRSN